MMQANTLKTLVFGKDARTDAMLEACVRSRYFGELFVCTEFLNPGFISKSTGDPHCTDGCLTNLDEMLAYASEVCPDLALVGPEEPLEKFLVDRLEKLNIPTFGPYGDLAQIETSKSWARKLLNKYVSHANPQHEIFESTEGLNDYLLALGDFVIKPDGLTGGKGVRVSGEHLHSIDEAVAYAEELLKLHNRFVAEEKLVGEEFSLQSISDGYNLVHCPLVQDHKRAFVGDEGPNTGGMGSYSCNDFSLPFLNPEDMRQAQEINSQVISALREETSKLYRGVLYGNFIATAQGLKLIEYNARFGDPEAMNVLPLLETDFLEICKSVVDGTLSEIDVQFTPQATVCKYVVPNGYPTNPERGEKIEVPSELFGRDNLRVYFAAVNSDHGDIFLTGSRAVAFVGIADTLEDAEAIAEEAAASVKGPVRYRQDIGTSKLIDARIDRMSRIRGYQTTPLSSVVTPGVDRSTITSSKDTSAIDV